MSLPVILWLLIGFTACGVGAWLAMAGVILGMVAGQMVRGVAALRLHTAAAAILALVGLMLFIAGVAMLARVLA